jgi:hypothetical protein
MRLLALLGLLSLMSWPAAAITCDEVRGYVRTYGAPAVLAYVHQLGATPAQIRQGRSCLKSGFSRRRSKR